MVKRSGTVEECVREFVTLFFPHMTRSEFEQRNRLAQLIDVQLITLNSWFYKGQCAPIGINRIRLILVLELTGFKVTGSPQLESDVSTISKLIASRVLTVKEVSSLLDVKHERIMEWITHRVQPIQEVRAKIAELSASYTEPLNQALKRWKNTLVEIGCNMPSGSAITEQPVKPKQVVHAPESKSASLVMTRPERTNGAGAYMNNLQIKRLIMETAATLVISLRGLARRIISDDFTSDERKHFRDLTVPGSEFGSNGVFELSNLLNRLCGERARREISDVTSERIQQ